VFPAEFTIGVCASDSAPSLLSVLRTLRSEDFGSSFRMRRIVVVASGCPGGILSKLASASKEDERIEVITEPERRGKAEAVNRIMANSLGEYLVLLNSDAVPARGAIRALLEEVSSDERTGSVSARPVFRDSGGLLSGVLRIMWSTHNLASLRLNHAKVSNHTSDELFVARRNLLAPLPPNLVNDGAYIGGRIRAGGHLVKFSQRAVVSIDVPKRPADLINQRRRIVFGHVQVWKKLGSPPMTVESLLFMKPGLSVRILVESLASSPRLIAALPIAVVSEVVSGILAMSDHFRSTKKHAVWKRYAV
jgi:cellulose synthase/poly-beta-1,6-N-acetylglucosamine synthase-like glycosyltransferase